MSSYLSFSECLNSKLQCNLWPLLEGKELFFEKKMISHLLCWHQFLQATRLCFHEDWSTKTPVPHEETPVDLHQESRPSDCSALLDNTLIMSLIYSRDHIWWNKNLTIVFLCNFEINLRRKTTSFITIPGSLRPGHCDISEVETSQSQSSIHPTFLTLCRHWPKNKHNYYRHQPQHHQYSQ